MECGHKSVWWRWGHQVACGDAHLLRENEAVYVQLHERWDEVIAVQFFLRRSDI
jgi:hypothetical protein